MNGISAWIHKRANVHVRHRSHIVNQRKHSLYLLAFGVVRIIAWTILALLVGLGLAHVGGFGWAKDLAQSIPFVVMISIYANWATDLDAATAAYAALVAADGHAATMKEGRYSSEDHLAIELDIAKLASLQPGQEAVALAESIKARLYHKEAKGDGK